MRVPRPRLAGAAVAFGSMVFLAGCAEDATSPAGSAAELTPAEFDEISIDFEDDADLSIGSLLHGGSMNAFDQPAVQFLGPPDRSPGLGPIARCVILEPLPPEDPDGDRIPTRLTLRFDPDPCVFRLGRTTIEFSGQIDVSDPVPDVAGYDISEVIRDFGVAHVLPNGRARAMVRSGTRDVAQDRDNDRLTATEMLTTKHSTPGRASKSASADWQLVFDGSDPIVFREPLPSGSLTLRGVWVHTKNDRSRAFEVTTPTALQYDASCRDARPMFRFTEGVIQKTLKRNDTVVAVVTLTWTGCGERPTREVRRADGTTIRPERR